MFSIFLLGTVLALPVYAQEVVNDLFLSEEDAFFFGEEETLFTATKYIKRLNEAPAIATVITAKQIRQMGAENLYDILRTVPGLGITKTWVYFHSIEVRGIKTEDSEKVLIMIDGHRLNVPYFGGALEQNYLTVDNIKRIEIIRGPGSALYGSNAFVATINIITKEAKDIEGIELTTGLGSFDTKRYNLLYGLEKNDFRISGTFNYYETDGARRTTG